MTSSSQQKRFILANIMGIFRKSGIIQIIICNFADECYTTGEKRLLEAKRLRYSTDKKQEQQV